jgi:hypothetical protein
MGIYVGKELHCVALLLLTLLKEWNCTYTMLPIYQYYYKIYLNLILIRIHINLKKNGIHIKLKNV